MRLILAAAQSTSVAGEVARNVVTHLKFATAAAERGVRLLVFPELSLTGYELAIARVNAVRPDSPDLDPLRRLAAEAGMTVVVGAPVLNDRDELNIAALAMSPDGSMATYTKVHVHESERDVFTAGTGGPVLAVEDARVGLAICADASHPQHAARAAVRGANVYAAGAMIIEDEYGRKAGLLGGYAREHGMAVLLANYSGSTGGCVSAGKSALWNESGELVAASSGNESALVIGTREDGVWSGVVVPVV